MARRSAIGSELKIIAMEENLADNGPPKTHHVKRQFWSGA
jgi:hypothetical protein